MKARCRDLAKARQVAQGLPAKLQGEGDQVDTYFCSPQGRLKLRQSSFDDSATVVWYLRANDASPRPSEYRLARVRSPQNICEVFTMRFGVLGIVKKHRAVFIHEGIRINLDTVEGLGDFVEFEAPAGDRPKEAQQAVACLMQAFGIKHSDLVGESYSDLLLK